MRVRLMPAFSNGARALASAPGWSFTANMTEVLSRPEGGADFRPMTKNLVTLLDES